MPVPQRRQRPDHLRLSLVGDEVRDGHEGRLGPASGRRPQVGAEMDRVEPEQRAGHVLDAAACPEAVRDHRVGPAQGPADHGPPALGAARAKRQVAPVHRNDERRPARAAQPPQHGISGRHRVVRVHDVEGPFALQLVERAAERAGGPPSPCRVCDRARRRHEAHIPHRDAVEHGGPGHVPSAPQPLAQRGRPAAQRAERWQRPLEGEHPDLHPMRLHRHRLPVGPYAERRVRRSRVVLRHHRDAQRPLSHVRRRAGSRPAQPRRGRPALGTASSSRSPARRRRRTARCSGLPRALRRCRA